MADSKPSVELAAMELFELAMEQAPDDREAFIAEQPGIDEAVKSRALELLEANKNSFVSLRTGGAASLDEDDETQPHHIGAYRILRLLGRGGMGSVYMGERASDDFDHVVAIKLIKPGLLSDTLIERFRRERQILAGLNHQHIAHLHDGGETDEGAPYIVMEYVDGVPLTKWMDEQSPSLNRRLDLFLQICGAVEFAHQNLVIHRDLTPSNVLVTAGDQAKLIDFGIARPQVEDDDGGEASTFSGLSLTPGFAAPERSQGAAANTLSDIYSLGRILQVLIKSAGEAELAAIVDKATNDEPERRYPTARGLTDDLQNFRGNHPVTAFSNQKRYRFRKFVVRQKLAIGATAAVILMLVAGLGGTGWAYNRAENARAEAEQSFAETRSIAKVMMFDVFDEVSKVPRSTKARQLLAETAQKYLDSLAADKSATVDVQLDAGQGYFRLSRVIGGTQGATLGKLSDGKALLSRSREILERLHETHPERQDVKAALGQVLTIVAGETLYTDGDFKTAGRLAARARRILLDVDDPDTKVASALGSTYYFEGESYSWAADTKKAAEIFALGIKAIGQLPAPLRKSLDVKRSLATLLVVSANNFATIGDFDNALGLLADGLKIRREVAKRSNNAPGDVRTLTIGYHLLGQIQIATARFADASQSAEQAVKLSRDAMAESPNDVGPKELFTGMALLKGQALSGLGKHGEAVSIAEEGIAVNRELLKLSGDVAAGPMNVAVRLHEAAAIYTAAGQTQRSCSSMREAVGIIKDFAKTAELPASNREGNLKPMLAALTKC